MLENIGVTLSAGIARFKSDARQRSAERIDRQRHALEQLPAEGGAALLAALFGPLRIAEILHGCGAALWTEQGALRVGETLGLEWLNAFAQAQQSANWVVLHATKREELEAMAGPVSPASSVAGIIVIRVPGPTPIFLFCFRQELIREVQWGGDISHPVLRDEISGRMSPRRSFAIYQETVRGQSLDWSATDLDLARVYAKVQGARLEVPAAARAQICADALIALHDMIGETSSLLHSLLDAFGEGISLLFRSRDEDLTLRYVNRKLLDWLEIESGDDEDMNRVSDLLGTVGVPPHFAEKVRAEPQVIALHLQSGGVRNLHVEFKEALDLEGPRGREGLSALIFTDITRLERGREALDASKAQTEHLAALNTALERDREALETSKAQTEHLAALKSAFLANMSHEIRTPMNGIICMLQVLRGTMNSPEQQHFLDIMDRSSETMLTVINDILDLAKLDAGRMEIEKVPFDLLELVQDVVNLMESRAIEKDLDFVLITGIGLSRHVLGDPTRLRQIIANLVSNGIKFTGYGKVAIEIKSKPIDAAKVKVTIKVIDTGIGIAEEYAPFVFEKFRQADASTTRKFGGTGLGLSITRQLVNLMHGEISFTSMVGKGTTFEINIPFELNPSYSRMVERAPVERTPLVDESPRHILVAEDNLINQHVFKAMFQNSGCVLDFADTGWIACEKSSARRYDLIFMDCHMPIMDGFEATEWIRKTEGGHRTPIIAVTANAMPGDRQRCLDAGMNDYLAKPIIRAELFAMIEKWCPKPNVQ